MKYFDWNIEKNRKLKAERDVGFEEVVIAIHSGDLLEVLDHPNKNRYPEQSVLIVCLREYVYIVPFVEDEEKIFLKTIIPSRKMTKKFISNKNKKIT